MNRIYWLVWNIRIGAFVAVCELTRSRGKRGSAIKAALHATAILGLGAQVWAAPPGNHGNGATTQAQPSPVAAANTAALPTNGVVTSGNATIATSGNGTADHMTIDQASQSAIINWQSFNIGQGDSVQFVQPNSHSVALNRVLGQNPSDILGQLSANGQIFLVNPSGILFGRGASVNVDGLVASTLSISDSDFVAGNYRFSGVGSHASVRNQGSISANTGYVAMLGASVSNTGLITARLGTVALASGEAITLDLAGDGLLNVSIDRGAVHGEVENGGIIKADGGQVVLTTQAAGNLLSTAVNNTGVIQAQTVDNHDGTIRLLGDMQSGSVDVAGTLDASAPQGGNGGSIETSAARVNVAADARITTAATAHGQTGTWVIDPQDFTIAATGGDETGTALSTALTTSNVTIDSNTGANAGSGNINVNDGVSWSANTLTLTAANNINVNATMTASGAASLTLNPSTTNGADTAVAGGTVIMGLSPQTGFYGQVNFSGTGVLTIGGQVYTVINSLGTVSSSNDGSLQGIQGNLSGDYALGSNLIASATTSWNSGAGFTPIGTQASPFTGTLEGLGHTVSGLYVHAPSTSYQGLFGAIDTAGTVRNVGLPSAAVTGSNNAGALAGSNSGTVLNDYSSGSVTAQNSGTAGGLVGDNAAGGTIGNSYSQSSTVAGNIGVAGGLVGSNEGSIGNSFAAGSVAGGEPSDNGGLVGINSGTITASYATGNVQAGGPLAYTGGLAGANTGTIDSTYASGRVSNGEYNGGLVGYNNGTITNSYANGPVGAVTFVGGLVGLNDGVITDSYALGNENAGNQVGGLVGSNNGTITNTYSTGSVTGTGTEGGLVGTNSGTITASFWDTATSGQSSSAGGTGVTTAQLRTPSYLAGLNFTSTPGATGNNWVIVNTDGTLATTGSTTAGGTFPLLASEYSTSIWNPHQLQLMSMNPGANYTITQTLFGQATYGLESDVYQYPAFPPIVAGYDVWYQSGFIPVGNPTTPFTGTLNGQSNYIYGLGINLPGSADVGLFGVTSSGASISNLFILQPIISGGSNVGAVAGVNNGSISSVGALAFGGASVTGTGISVGAVVGQNAGTMIQIAAEGQSAGAGVVNGTASSVGGAVGTNTGSMTDVQGNWNVTGVNNVGGLVGVNLGPIATSVAAGTVNGTNQVGGFAGLNSAAISNSSATGAVTGSLLVGGFAGVNGPTAAAAITDSYATGAVSGSGNVGGLVGANQLGTIDVAFAFGAVSDTGGNAGGLVGNNTGSITDSYATGAVGGTLDVGGLIGLSTSGTITNTYASGAVTGPAGSSGGLIGSNSATVTNSFWDTQETGMGATGVGTGSATGATGMTTADMQTQANFTSATAANGNANPGWDFTNTWTLYAGDTEPLLRTFMTPLTITAGNLTQTYGVAPPTSLSSPSYTLSGGDNNLFGLTAPYSADVNAGTYQPNLWSDQLGYLITYSGGTLTVNPATLTYTANPAITTYGTPASSLSGAVSGFVSSDTLANATTGTLTFTTPATAPSNVGTYAINGSGLTANNGNYVFVQAPANATALTINPATLTYTPTTGQGMTYGSAVPTLTGSVTGLVNGQTLASATTGTLTFTTNATNFSNVGSYGIAGSGLSANNGNYVFVQSPDGSTAFTISPATLTYAATPVSITTGSTIPALSGSVNGFVNGDTLTSATTGTPAFATSATSGSNPGNYPIDGSGLTANNGNYVFTQAPQNATALDILPTVTPPPTTPPPTTPSPTPATPTPYQDALASADSPSGQMSWVGNTSDPGAAAAPSLSGPTNPTAVNNATASNAMTSAKDQLPGVPLNTSGQQWGGLNLTVIDGGVNTQGSP